MGCRAGIAFPLSRDRDKVLTTTDSRKVKRDLSDGMVMGYKEGVAGEERAAVEEGDAMSIGEDYVCRDRATGDQAGPAFPKRLSVNGPAQFVKFMLTRDSGLPQARF